MFLDPTWFFCLFVFLTVEAVAGETEVSVKVKGMASKNSETPRPHEATLYISKGKIIRLDGEAKQVSTPESDSGLD